MKNLILLVLISILFTGCTAKELMLECKTPDVAKAKAGKNELEYLNNKFIENEQLHNANEVCK